MGHKTAARPLWRRLLGIGRGHLHNPWWCSSFSIGEGFSAWWRICDCFGINISRGRTRGEWPKSHPKEEYMLLDVGLLGWRFEILRPHRHTRFPWEAKRL